MDVTQQEAHLVQQMRAIQGAGGMAQAVVFRGPEKLARVVCQITASTVTLFEKDQEGEFRALVLRVAPEVNDRLVQAVFAHEMLDELLGVVGQHEIIKSVEEDAGGGGKSAGSQ